MVATAERPTAKPEQPPFKPEPGRRYSVAEYLEFERRTGERYDYHNGILIPMAGGTISHNLIASNINFELQNALFDRPDFYVFGSDQKVRIPKGPRRYVYPDAIVVAGAPILADDEAHAITNPILIVEVLSDSTGHHDSNAKFFDYQDIPSFREYVLVWQDRPDVQVFLRQAPDLWRSSEISGLHSDVVFESIGVRLSLERIYRKVTFENA
ncbi:MAG: Uma2 family endonuclease [Saprospiraceae bacterium]